MTGASILLQALQHHQVTDLFGYPGGAIMPIYDAIYQSDLNHYLCRHEQGAAFAALGYARASKNEGTVKVGVCMATSGPGATNLLTGLADAMSDSVPVVAITGQVASHALGSDAFQEVDIVGMSLAITKHCFQISCVEEIPTVVNQAFELAVSGRPGPVLIDIPKDIQVANADHVTLTPVSVEKASKATPQNDYQQACEMINHAQKPVIYVGAGVALASAVEELREFINITQLPSVSTLKGLGCIAPDTKYYMGMLGMHGTRAANLAVQESDLLITLGARFDDRVTGKLTEFAPHAKVIHFDVDMAEINKRRHADCPIAGDLKDTLRQLNNVLSTSTNVQNKSAWLSHCQKMTADFGWQYNHPGELIYAPALLNNLSQTLQQQRANKAIVTTDVGQHQMWVAQHMNFEHPSDFLTSGGLGTMGFGVPAAIGAQISRPQDCVVAVTGDGSFMMNVQELGTIKRFNLPVKILLLDNSRLGMVRQWQQIFFEERYSETNLSDNPDFVTLAKAFDIEAKTITQKSEISDALDTMINHQGAYLLHVCIDEMENVWPLVPPETANDKMMEST